MSQINQKPSQILLVFMVIVSFSGLILAILFAARPLVSQENFAFRKIVVGSTFSTICLLGILAVLFPDPCSRPFEIRRRENHEKSVPGFKQGLFLSQNGASALRGHHPTCGHFSGHVFRVNSWTFCATCSGLFLGALIALSGVGLYFFEAWQLGQNALLIVLVGAVGVTLGLLQSPLHIFRTGVSRMFTSTYFVVGTFLILVGVDVSAHNTSADLFIVALSVFWLITRMAFSKWDHQQICSKCALDNCGFADRTRKAG